MITIQIILTLIFAIRGIEQGILWSREAWDAFTWDEHIPFIIQRIILIPGLLIAGAHYGFPTSIYALLCFVPAFWFWHNGMIYETFKRINNAYPDGFFDHDDDPHGFAPDFELRMILFGTSIVLTILSFYIDDVICRNCDPLILI